ncbi:hypothetical protein [Microvirga makkahensis]|uniref:Uncharacterized protein n=1 Tax=Microvirga makkahensis TaxID=1128670 RepID=A0A7X3SNR8_9HYPH|nr:hypothetical protein [Microvirga makkahensis]MXQ11691.1 hypothetical protein [Microvirga makkahensis]
MKSFLGVAVLLGAAGMFASNKAEALDTWIGSWDYVLQHDQEGRPSAAFARLRGDDEALLWLTCARYPTDGKAQKAVSLSATVSQKSYLGRSPSRGRSTVYWFDDGSPELSYWVYRERAGQIASAEQVTRILEKMTDAQSLVIELSNYRYETLRSQFQFNPLDTKRVAERFRQDCRAIAGPANADSPSIR